MSWPTANQSSNRLGVFLKLANATFNREIIWNKVMCNDFHTVDTALKWKAIELILLIFFVVLYNQLSIMFRYKFPAEKSSTNIHNIQFDSLQLCWVNSLFVFLPFFKSCSSCVARYLTSCWINSVKYIENNMKQLIRYSAQDCFVGASWLPADNFVSSSSNYFELGRWTVEWNVSLRWQAIPCSFQRNPKAIKRESLSEF